MLKLSADRKVSPRSRYEAGKKTWKPKVKNSFGLPAGDSCPGKTDFCALCYADKLQKCWSNVDKLVWHNFDLLNDCGNNVSKMVDLLDPMVKSVKWGDEEPVFRWMWNGDIFSKAFAHAVAKICELNPGVQFWIYTRSFDWVGVIANVPNLTVYLSVDNGNFAEARRVFKKYPNVLIAACAETWDETEEMMRQIIGRNAPRCPELTKRIPLVNEDGVGACVACGMCIWGKNHVRFASKH